MKTLIVWVLIFGYNSSKPGGGNDAITVPGISSEAECIRLAGKLNGDSWIPRNYRCESYEVAVLPAVAQR